MISEWRLSALVGQIRGVEYQLTRKRELAGELTASADEYSQRALEPAASATSAAESARVADTLSTITGDHRSRLDAEIESLEEEKRGLCRHLHDEGMQTGRWIGIGQRFVYLSGEDSEEGEDRGEATGGQLLQMHDIPAGYKSYMPVGEDPAITARRVEYAETYCCGKRQLTWIMGLMVGVFFLLSWEFIPLWLTLIGLLAALGVCVPVFPEGAKMAARMAGPGDGPHPPYLEVMPDSGERFDTGKATWKALASADEDSLQEDHEQSSTETDQRRLNANDYQRGYAFAQIKAEEATAKKKAAKKGRGKG